MTDNLVSEFLLRIDQAQKLGDWSVVEHWAKQWIQSTEKNAEAFRWLARASLGLHKLERAAYAFNRVLDFHPSDPEAAAFFQEYPSTASPQRLNASSAAPSPSSGDLSTQLSPRQKQELAETELSLGQRYFDFGLFAQAAQRFEQSFFWKPTEEAALGYARSLHQCGDSHKAQRFLRDKIDQSGEWIRGQLLLGNILFDMGQLRSAQTEWQNVLKADPHNTEALRFLRGYYGTL